MQEEEVQAAKKDPPLQVARDSSFLDAPFTTSTMVPTPSRREVKRIKKGTYAHFETSLSHRRSRFLTPRREAKKGKHRRQVSDLGSWLEAWHIFVAIRVQIPLELVNYQSIIYQLFSVYSVAASLKYDKLFRQAEAKNKQQTLRLDAVKEDLLVWCVRNLPFRTRQQPSANPQIGTSTGASATHSEATSGSHHHVEHTTHTPSDEEVCQRFNLGQCIKRTERAFCYLYMLGHRLRCGAPRQGLPPCHSWD